MIAPAMPTIAIPAQPALCCALPAVPLRPWIDHYWLSLCNDSPEHAILPDGSIDLVIRQGSADAAARLYGTTTSFLNVGLERGAHYVGIRFKPGQARHFLKAAAKELTDRSESVSGLLPFSVDHLAGHVGAIDIFARIDAVLLDHAASVQPAPDRIDAAIALIAAAPGMLRIEQAAAAFGTGRRQFERIFLEAVGIAPKLFSSILRFHRAGRLLRETPAALADIAHACGYADQSHMNRDFRRLAGMPPSAYAHYVPASLQNGAAPPAGNKTACRSDAACSGIKALLSG